MLELNIECVAKLYKPTISNILSFLASLIPKNTIRPPIVTTDTSGESTDWEVRKINK